MLDKDDYGNAETYLALNYVPFDMVPLAFIEVGVAPQSEIMQVVDINSTNTITVERGMRGSRMLVHVPGSPVQVVDMSLCDVLRQVTRIVKDCRTSMKDNKTSMKDSKKSMKDSRTGMMVRACLLTLHQLFCDPHPNYSAAQPHQLLRARPALLAQLTHRQRNMGSRQQIHPGRGHSLRLKQGGRVRHRPAV